MSEPRLAIVGCGTMGEAILGGLLRAGVFTADRLVATVRRPDAATRITNMYGVEATIDNAAACSDADIVLVALKPQRIRELLDTDAMRAALRGKLLVSIAAGTRVEQLGRWVPEAVVVRAMPNTPCLVGRGMTVLASGPGAVEEHIALARRIFEPLGRVLELEDKHMDAVTSLNGSGPAFTYVMLEALADGGVMMGLPRGVALVMEYVEGENLTSWLACDPGREAILGAFLAAGRGLAAAHAHGIVHRDFKPGNVIVARDGAPRVVDFGVATVIHDGEHASPSTEHFSGSDLTATSTSSRQISAPNRWCLRQSRCVRRGKEEEDTDQRCAIRPRFTPSLPLSCSPWWPVATRIPSLARRRCRESTLSRCRSPTADRAPTRAAPTARTRAARTRAARTRAAPRIASR